MNLKDLAVITGLPGIQRIVNTRKNGVMAEDLATGKLRFASARKHQISPLESIAIFTTDNDPVELAKVFQTMYEQLAELPLPASNASADELRDYFTAILPNHDPYQVHTSDIRKVVKWFAFLHEKGFITAEAPPEETEQKGAPEPKEEKSKEEAE
ncbi:MAG: hypothetical protein KatS3mg030_124 [Saprospiraceae bacterium]|nr:MAG: hypothetical protein KatS3mg030_124 [Saprospiraceae bacterium]